MRNEVLEILLDINPDIDYENEQALVDGGLIDSLEIMQIFAEIEERFEIQISVNDVVPENFNSLDAICQLIEKKSN